MILYPSIHIKDGAVARLTHGATDLRQVDILHPDPANRAAEFEAQGFEWLHVVDLNGAFEGRISTAPIEAILKRVKIPVQLSGGIRDIAAIDYWMDKGIGRIALTSAALQNPELVREACKKYPGRVAVKIDARGGLVTTTGWLKTTTTRALDLALRVEEAGAATIIYADINRDGALSEINTEAVVDLAFALTVPVIASGGVHSLGDLTELKNNVRAGISGLILGRALYSGDIIAAEALKLAAA